MKKLYMVGMGKQGNCLVRTRIEEATNVSFNRVNCKTDIKEEVLYLYTVSEYGECISTPVILDSRFTSLEIFKRYLLQN